MIKNKTIQDEDRREHAGGVPPAEKSFGVAHPIVEFDFDSLDEQEKESRTIEEFSDALVEITEWLSCTTNNRDKCPKLDPRRQHGIAVRVMALNYILRPHQIGVTSQTQLAKRLGISRSWLNEIVSGFVDRFGFQAVHMHLHRKKPRP